MSDLIYKIGISLIDNVGDVNAKKTHRLLRGAEAVFRERKSDLLKIPGIGTVVANSIAKQDVLNRAQKEVGFIEKHNIDVHYFLDDSYPYRLKHCDDGPIMLYSKGVMNLNAPRTISIVGSRNITPYGKDFCTSFVESLSSYRPTIISGLAYGVDIHAHREAVKNDIATIGVLAHGLDRLYPALHKKKMLLK